MGSVGLIIFILLLFAICLPSIPCSSILSKEKINVPKKVELKEIEKNKVVEKTNKQEEMKTSVDDNSKDNLRIITAARVEEINKSNKKWKARVHSRFADKTPEELRHFLGIKRTPSTEHRTKREKRRKILKSIRSKRESNKITDAKPLSEYQEFDARKEWPECSDVIDIIQDQSACGSCWAVSSASVMQDRICISSGGEIKINISSEDILSCEKQSFGCDGGWPENAFSFWMTNGVCTGSDYKDHEGCKPYPFPPNPDRYYSTPRCKRRCENRKYKNKYNKDKHYGLKPVNLQDSEEVDIMNAIIEGGPVEADMIVYDDFFHYSEGVYEADEAAVEAGGHAVRIIGWGYHNESDTPYWTVANSWGKWGMNGYFKIARGQDECFIESWGVNYADPALNNNTLTKSGAIRAATKQRQEKIEMREKSSRKN